MSGTRGLNSVQCACAKVWNARAHPCGRRVLLAGKSSGKGYFWARKLATTNRLKFHPCGRGYFYSFFNAMSANISEEVLTSKRQGLSEEELLRERERARNNRQKSSAVERERENERAREKRCRSTEVQQERQEETQLSYGWSKVNFIAWQIWSQSKYGLKNENWICWLLMNLSEI